MTYMKIYHKSAHCQQGQAGQFLAHSGKEVRISGSSLPQAECKKRRSWLRRARAAPHLALAFSHFCKVIILNSSLNTPPEILPASFTTPFVAAFANETTRVDTSFFGSKFLF